jgi:nucleotidyltransferase/DNA polymerase involved in DNA repair
MSAYPDPKRTKLPRDILQARFGRKKADVIGATLHGIDKLIVVTERLRERNNRPIGFSLLFSTFV